MTGVYVHPLYGLYGDNNLRISLRNLKLDIQMLHAFTPSGLLISAPWKDTQPASLFGQAEERDDNSIAFGRRYKSCAS